MKKNVIHILLCLLLSGATCIVYPSGGNKVISRKYTMADGLSSNRIYSIVQDSLGFVWFGTNDGLNRFDGVGFRKYYYRNGDANNISSNSIRWLMIDRRNRMWISLDNGVDLYDPATDSFRRFDRATPDGETISGRVLEIMEDSRGEVWIGTQNQGLFRYSPDDDRLKVYRHTPADESTVADNWIKTIYEDRRGNIWVGTYSRGLCAFDRRTEQFTVYRHSPEEQSAADNSIVRLYEDSSGDLWVGTFRSGLGRFDREKERFVDFSETGEGGHLYHIHDIMEYRPGELLVASDNGVAIFNTADGKLSFEADDNLRELPPVNTAVYELCRDREGGVWMGTYFEGVEYLPPVRRNFAYYGCTDPGAPETGRVVRTITEAGGGRFWIGTDDNGIFIHNPADGTTKPFRTASDIHSMSYCVTDLLEDDGKLFVAAYGRGLEIIDLASGRVKLYSPDPGDRSSIPSERVLTLFRNGSGRIYIGTSAGLCYYDPAGDRFIRIGPGLRIAAVAEDNNENLWIATRNDGLYHYDVRRDEVKRYTFDPGDGRSLVRNVLKTITYDSKGRLWIGSDGYGICRYDAPTDSFVRYDEPELPNNIISQIIEVGDRLWIFTNKGAVRWNPDTGQTKTYSHSSGLYDEQFSSQSGLYASDGRIYIGTTDGFCVFTPGTLTENQYAPPVVITRLSVNNAEVNPSSGEGLLKRSVEMTREIVLAHNQSMIEVEFASLSYVEPRENLYQYMLEGLDPTWRTANGQNPRISYANLPSGRYTLHIRGTNSDKIWSPHTAELDIAVKPHFLRSNMAVLMYGICLLAAIYLLTRYLLRRSDKKHNERIRKLEIESQQAVYDAKIEFFTNIAHEIRTPLSLIIGPLEYVMRSHGMNGRYGEYLSIIEQNYRRLYALVTQLLDFRKVDTGNYAMHYTPCRLSELIDGVITLFRITAQQKGIEITLRVEPDGLTLTTDREAFTKVITNLISNAIKYACKEICITARQSGGSVVLTVGDDGPGIDDSERQHIFKAFYQIAHRQTPANKGVGIGLHITRSLVELMGGTIGAEGRADGASGIVIRVELPVREAVAPGQQAARELEEIFTGDTETLKNPDITGGRTAGETAREYTVMIVDDNPEILDFLSRILTHDYFVISVLNGDDALHILGNNRIDLIVSDIMMDEMDGLELCRRIKTNIHTSHIPVVILTAKTDMETRIKSLEYGADAYIEKPFSPLHLTIQLQNLIRSRNELKQKFASTPFSEVRITTHNKLDEAFVEKCSALINEHLSSSDFSIDKLARELGMSRTSVFVKLKAITGMTPNDFIKLIRLKTACKMMTEGEYRVTEIGFLVGFNSASYFAKCFSKQFGMLPVEFMKKLKEQ